MPISIVSNSAALFARDAVSERSEALAESTNRLSSGQRIVNASDDASAMVIGNNLRVQIASFRTAQINAAGGISLAQVADGALNEMSDIMARMKTIALQSASGQFSAVERSVIDAEYQALLSELDRIAGDTTFNGVQLLNGGTTTESDMNNLGGGNLLVPGFDGVEIDDPVGNSVFKFSYDSVAGTMNGRNMVTGDNISIPIDPTAIGAGSTELIRFGAIGVQVTLDSAFDKTSDIAGVNTASITGGTGAIDAGTIALGDFVVDSTNPFNFGDIDASTVTVNAGVPAASSLSITFNGTAFTATGVDLSSTGTKTATLADGNGNSFEISFDVGTAFNGAETTTLSMVELGQLVGSTSATQSSTTFNFQVGSSTASTDRVSFSVDAVTVSDLGLFNTNVLTVAGARTAITALDGALDNMSNARASLGAAMQRLEFSSNALVVAVENAESTRSGLLDVDVAAEITAISQSEALLEASISMLARANLQPNILLGLLRNS